MRQEKEPNAWKRISDASHAVGVDPKLLPIIAVIAILIGTSLVTGKSNFAGDLPEPTRPQTRPAAKEVSPPDWWLKQRAEREVKGLLRDPESATFTEVSIRRSPALVVCGLVNSRNGFGGMSGKQRFISGAVTALQEQMDPREMESLWGRVC